MNAKPGMILLIVDDDARLRELAEYAAHRSGHFSKIMTATDGQAAVELLASSSEETLPSAILTDLTMPRLDGLDLVRWIQQQPRLRDIPIAMFSSSNHPNDETLAIEAGCRVFYPKPKGLEQLTAMMTAVAEIIHKPAGADR